MSSIETLIGTLGFPIAVTAFLLYERQQVRKETTENRDATLKTVLEALDNNTEALTELKTLIKERNK